MQTLTITCNRQDLVRALKACLRSVCRAKENPPRPTSKIWGVVGANQTLSLYAADGHRLTRADVTTASLDTPEGEYSLTLDHARDLVAGYTRSEAVSVPLTLTQDTSPGARPFVRQVQWLASNSIQSAHVEAAVARGALKRPGNRVSKNARVHFSVERDTWHTRVVTDVGEGEPVLLTSEGTWHTRTGAEIRVNQRYLNDAIAECRARDKVTVSFGKALDPLTICYSAVKVVIMPVRF